MLKSYKNGNSLFWSLSVGGVFQIKGEVNDSHLKREEKLLKECSNLVVSTPFQTKHTKLTPN